MASAGKVEVEGGGGGGELGQLATHGNSLRPACSAPGVSVILPDRQRLVGRQVLVWGARDD